jgi:hypothetical protein
MPRVRNQIVDILSWIYIVQVQVGNLACGCTITTIIRDKSELFAVNDS